MAEESVNSRQSRLNSTSSYDEQTDETDMLSSNTQIQMNGKSFRTLYFSDGTLEEIIESDNEDNDVTDNNLNIEVDENTLPFIPRMKYRATKLGERVLAGIDFLGEGLASFLGITTPKYGSQVEYCARNADEEGCHNESNNGWHNNNDSVVVTDQIR